MALSPSIRVNSARKRKKTPMTTQQARQGPPMYPAFGPEVTINVNEEVPSGYYPATKPQQSVSVQTKPTGTSLHGGVPSASAQQSRPEINVVNQPRSGQQVPSVQHQQHARMSQPTAQGYLAVPHGAAVPCSVAPVNVLYSPTGRRVQVPVPQQHQSFWKTPMGIVSIVALALVVGLIAFFLIKFLLDEQNRVRNQQISTQQHLMTCNARANRLAAEVRDQRAAAEEEERATRSEQRQPVNIFIQPPTTATRQDTFYLPAVGAPRNVYDGAVNLPEVVIVQ
jgi:hypothetical protein